MNINLKYILINQMIGGSSRTTKKWGFGIEQECPIMLSLNLRVDDVINTQHKTNLQQMFTDKKISCNLQKLTKLFNGKSVMLKKLIDIPWDGINAQLFGFDNNFCLEWDTGGFEFKSMNHENIKVSDCINEITNQKQKITTFFNTYNIITTFYDIYSIYNTTSDYNNFEYTGNIELNITLPYETESTGRMTDPNLAKFKKDHIALMKSIQYLSPLFLACFTGVSPNTYLDDHANPEISYRSVYEKVGLNVLSTPVNNTLYTDGVVWNPQSSNEDLLNLYKSFYINKPHNPDTDFKLKNEFGINRKPDDLKYNPTNCKYFGFEWKMLGQYPLQYASHISLLIFMIAQWLQNNHIDIPDNPIDILLAQSDPLPDQSVLDNKLVELQQKEQDIPESIDDETGVKYKTQSYKEDIEDIFVQIASNKIKLGKFFTHILQEGWNSFTDNNIYIEILIEKLNFEFLRDYIPPPSENTNFNLLQFIHSYLYDYFKNSDNTCDIINCFFPTFQTDAKYNNLKELPNINMMEYNYMKSISNKRSNTPLSSDHEDYIDYQSITKLTNDSSIKRQYDNMA